MGTMQLPRVYDWAMSPLESLLYARRRHALFGPLRGTILELGAGTGANLGAYGASAHVTALEIEPATAHIAQQRASSCAVRVVVGDAQQLPFAAGSFDYVTTALVFCSLPEPSTALHEIARVLRRGGRLVQLEHTRTGHARTDWLLRTAAPTWKCITGGCNIHRDTVALVQQHGWQLVRHERHVGGLVRVIEALPPQEEAAR